MGTDIPIWIGGLQKWITGVTKHTTCEEIIKAVLASNDERHPKSKPRDSKNYTIFERWHKMERPLDSRSRLLKAWNTWGVEQSNVRFLLKKSHHTQTTPKDVKAHRRKVRECKPSTGSRSSRTFHPRKLRSESEDDYLVDDEEFPATAEELKNLITAQEDAINSQMRCLQEKDNEIELIENQIHLQRMHQIGVNYVQDTYLAESSEGESWSSSSGQEGMQQSCDILDTCIELYEKVLSICDKVHQEEHHIKELTAKLKETLSFKNGEHNNIMGKLSIESGDPELLYAGPERLEEMLQRTRQDIDRLLKISETQQQTILQNEQTLSDCTKIIEDKHCYLQQLKSDLERLNKDNSRLQEEYSSLHSAIPLDGINTCDIIENGDSNSDTGLSSLHSSSDDGVPVLDTLV